VPLAFLKAHEIFVEKLRSEEIMQLTQEQKSIVETEAPILVVTRAQKKLQLNFDLAMYLGR